MTQIRLTTVLTREDAKPICEALQGRSYMSFRVAVCPTPGGFELFAETDYPAEELEIREMVIASLCQAIL